MCVCVLVSVCVCLRSPDLSRSQNKVLESLEFIPHHEQPVTISNYYSIRRYLIKVQPVKEARACVRACVLVEHSAFVLSGL